MSEISDKIVQYAVELGLRNHTVTRNKSGFQLKGYYTRDKRNCEFVLNIPEHATSFRTLENQKSYVRRAMGLPKKEKKEVEVRPVKAPHRKRMEQAPKLKVEARERVRVETDPMAKLAKLIPKNTRLFKYYFEIFDVGTGHWTFGGGGDDRRAIERAARAHQERHGSLVRILGDE